MLGESQTDRGPDTLTVPSNVARYIWKKMLLRSCFDTAIQHIKARTTNASSSLSFARSATDVTFMLPQQAP